MLISARAAALATCVCVLALPVVSLAVSWRIPGLPFVGWFLFALGSAVACTNFFLTFLRRPVLRLLGRPAAANRHVSVFPLVGMCVLPGLALLPASRGLSVATLALVLCDTGNLLWVLVAVWKDDAFWRDVSSPSGGRGRR
jgi:hypothetical protein